MAMRRCSFEKRSRALIQEDAAGSRASRASKRRLHPDERVGVALYAVAGLDGVDAFPYPARTFCCGNWFWVSTQLPQDRSQLT